MKLPLYKISELVTELTGISLTEMRMKTNDPKIVTARHIFYIASLKHGVYTKKEAITLFINQTQSSINYADQQSYRFRHTLKTISEMVNDEQSKDLAKIKEAIFIMAPAAQINLANDILKHVGNYQIYSH